MSAEDRKLKFVEAYLSNNGNLTAAALAAGYSKGGAPKAGYRLSKDAAVMSMLRQRQDILCEKLGLTTEKTLREIARLAYSDIRKMYNEDGSLKKVTDLDDDTAASISSVEVDTIEAGGVAIGTTKKIKTYDKRGALDMAMKFHGLYGRDNEQKPVIIEQRQPKDMIEAARIIAFGLAKGAQLADLAKKQKKAV